MILALGSFHDIRIPGQPCLLARWDATQCLRTVALANVCLHMIHGAHPGGLVIFANPMLLSLSLSDY
jgi:hypothetical protein